MSSQLGFLCEVNLALGTFPPKTRKNRKSEKSSFCKYSKQHAVRRGGPFYPILFVKNPVPGNRHQKRQKTISFLSELCRNFPPVSPDAKPASAPAASPAVWDTSVNTCETPCQDPPLTTTTDVRSLTTERITTPSKGRQRKEREERVCERSRYERETIARNGNRDSNPIPPQYHLRTRTRGPRSLQQVLG